jgi:hypothetical protein
MSYKLYLDKPTEFKCRVELEGASLKDASARLVIEGGSVKYLYDGTIDKHGNCVIPVGHLRELFEESDTGKMKLEVIADGTYFQPWSSDFLTTMSKKLQVEVFEAPTKPARATIKVNVETPESKLVNKIVEELRRSGITQKNALKHRTKIKSVLESHVHKSAVSIDRPASLISEIITKLD